MTINAREGYIYRIIAPGSNSVYVGQSYDPHKRFKQHKRFRGDNPKLANWLKKHPDAEIYFWPVIDMDAEEVAAEAECRQLGYDLLNLIPCGSAPPNRKGKPFTIAHRVRLSESSLGRAKSVEHRHSMSVSRKGRVPWNSGRKTGPLPAELRARLSKISMGKPKSAEHRANISKGKIAAARQVSYEKERG